MRSVLLCFLLLSCGVWAEEGAFDPEPYLRTGFPDLVAQIASKSTPYIIKRRAMRRLVARYPDRAADALVPFLYHPGAHLNEFTARLLFQLGKPNSKTSKLIRRIEQGRTSAREVIAAFAQALSWPGNKALAEAYLKAQRPPTAFTIAAVRTRDEECLRTVRAHVSGGQNHEMSMSTGRTRGVCCCVRIAG